jgi:phage shock protein E
MSRHTHTTAPFTPRTLAGLALALVVALAVAATMAGCSSSTSGSAATATAATATTNPSSTGSTVPGVGAAVGTVVTTPSGKGSWRRVSPAALAGMLKQKDFVLVNVHIPFVGEIAGTDLFLPYDQAAAEMNKLPADKAAKIVVYCRSGRMSTIAAAIWADAGYTNLYELDGGFDAWIAGGYPFGAKA